jgi:hypothetical protein
LASRKSGSYRQHQLGDQPALFTIFQTEFASMQPGGATMAKPKPDPLASLRAASSRMNGRFTALRYASGMPVPQSSTLNTIAFASWRSCTVISPPPYS